MMETIATESRTTWITKPIGDVLDVVTGNTPSKKESANDGDFMPFIKPPELQNGLIGQASEALSELGARSARVVPSGSVLISCIGNLGRVGLTDRPIAFNQQINAIKPHPDVVAKYLFYYFQGPLFRQALERASTATTVALVNKGNFEKLPLTYPPLPVQRRIVSAIETQLGRLDAAVARLRAAKVKLKRYKQAVLKAACDPFEKRPLAELASVITKGASPRWQGVKYVNDAGQTLFVTSENVREGFLDLAEPKYVENSFNELQKRSVLINGAVLLNIVGASIGCAAIYDRHDLANTNQAVCLIRTTDELVNGFLSNYLNSEEAKVYYSSNQVEVARANLSLKDVREMPVPFAPVEEQRTFNQELEERLDSTDEMMATLDAQLEQSTRLRQSVLKRAFEGRLV